MRSSDGGVGGGEWGAHGAQEYTVATWPLAHGASNGIFEFHGQRSLHVGDVVPQVVSDVQFLSLGEVTQDYSHIVVFADAPSPGRTGDVSGKCL